jgi:hypothetical protein
LFARVTVDKRVVEIAPDDLECLLFQVLAARSIEESATEGDELARLMRIEAATVKLV